MVSSKTNIAAIAGMAAGPLLAVVAVVGTVAQPDGFNFIEHPTSDLGADTANLAWFSNLTARRHHRSRNQSGPTTLAPAGVENPKEVDR